MKHTIYFIDSENVNDAWIELTKTAGEEDELLVFYTAKSPHMSYEKVMTLISAPIRNLHWIKCVEGANALDFQLVSELGYRIAKEEDAQFVIVTNDNGFEAAVRYWIEKGINIKRMKSSEVARIAATKSAETEKSVAAEPEVENLVAIDTKPQKPSIKKSGKTPEKKSKAKTEKTQDADVKESAAEIIKPLAVSDFESDIKSLAKSIPVTKLTIFHDSFVCIYGQDKGDEMYYAMKAAKSEVEKYKKLYLKRADSRNKSYIEFIYTKANYSKVIADKIATMYNKMENPTKNLQAMNGELIKTFGMALGNEYYKVIKKHIKVMNKI